MSKTKFLEVYSTFFPAGNPDQFCEHVFRSFDKDNSGKIDFKEFLLAINITSGGNPSQKLNWAFAMYDIDGNGTIEKNEMVEIIRVSIQNISFGLLTDTDHLVFSHYFRLFSSKQKVLCLVFTNTYFLVICIS